jgi:hypothetical protein
MRYLMLLAVLLFCGCNRAVVREDDYEPAVDSKTELQQLEERLGV